MNLLETPRKTTEEESSLDIPATAVAASVSVFRIFSVSSLCKLCNLIISDFRDAGDQSKSRKLRST